MVVLTRDPLNAFALCEGLAAPEDGALAVFLGIVRDHADGRAVRSLEYHAYEEMARAQLQAIGGALEERWQAKHWLLAHRLGPLAIGEVSMVVAVATPHREEAFAACRWAVEEIKARVPIWKKEYFTDGSSHWVGIAGTFQSAPSPGPAGASAQAR